jgi:hypothetical protein
MSFGSFSLARRKKVVRVTSSNGLDDLLFRVRLPVGSIIFSFPHRRDLLWGPPYLLLRTGWHRHFSRVKIGWGVKLTTHLELVCRRQENVDLYIHTTYSLPGVVVNNLRANANLSFIFVFLLSTYNKSLCDSPLCPFLITNILTNACLRISVILLRNYFYGWPRYLGDTSQLLRR